MTVLTIPETTWDTLPASKRHLLQGTWIGEPARPGDGNVYIEDPTFTEADQTVLDVIAAAPAKLTTEATKAKLDTTKDDPTEVDAEHDKALTFRLAVLTAYKVAIEAATPVDGELEAEPIGRP